MNYEESAFTFDCAGDQLVGVLAQPASRPACSSGVLIVVGGPQYRVGSHRQFVLLARHLAAEGVACMRFDYRGMGDASGEQLSFQAAAPDIGSAIDEFVARAPGIDRVILWGLCDGASAACLYAPTDPRVAGLVLLNPWVRTDATEARTYIKHYYARRILSRAFWTKLMGGRVGVVGAVRGFLVQLSRARRPDAGAGDRGQAAEPLPQRMLHAIGAAGCPTAVFLSGKDYVAREFEEAIRVESTFESLQRSQTLTVSHFENADHTFSSAAARADVANATLHHVILTDRSSRL